MAVGVDVGAGAQRELLAGERRVAAAEQRGQAVSGPPAARRVAATGSPAGGRVAAGQLDGVRPAALGDLLALAQADAHRQRLGARRRADRRVGAGDAQGVQHASEHRERLVGRRVDVGPPQPALGLGVLAEGLRGHERHAGDGHRGQRRLRLDLTCTAAARPSPGALGGERPDDQHMRRLACVTADDVAAVGRREGPGELDLDEAEQRARG